jgi:hypothetical protein
MIQFWVCDQCCTSNYFYLDRYPIILSRLSISEYSSDIQKTITSLMQLDNFQDFHSRITLINVYILLGGSLDSISSEQIDMLPASERMRIRWIKKQFIVIDIWKDLVRREIVKDINLDRAKFLEKNKKTILGEILLLDILDDSLLLFIQDEFNDLSEMNEEYFLEVLMLFVDFMTISVSINDSWLDCDVGVFTCQLNVEGEFYELVLNFHSHLVDEISHGLNQMLTNHGSVSCFTKIELISDIGFLFGNRYLVKQALSDWSIPFLSYSDRANRTESF